VARTILIGGACGAGKTSIARLGHAALQPMFGSTASIDTDTMFMMIDPNWELPYDERRARLMHRQVAMLAESFLDFGVDTVLVVGNALHGREAVQLLLEPLLPRGDVFHFLLDPDLHEIRRRVRARGDDKSDEWLQTHVDWVRDQCEGWTVRIDNTALTPRETAQAIARALEAGVGRLTASR
jgi:chloramphenicol 3-O-phosphotransferase